MRTKNHATYVYHLAIASGMTNCGVVLMTSPIAHFLADIAQGVDVDMTSSVAAWTVSWGHVKFVAGRPVLGDHFATALGRIEADLWAFAAAEQERAA
jgi:hypothetical protein